MGHMNQTELPLEPEIEKWRLLGMIGASYFFRALAEIGDPCINSRMYAMRLQLAKVMIETAEDLIDRALGEIDGSSQR